MKKKTNTQRLNGNNINKYVMFGHQESIDKQQSHKQQTLKQQKVYYAVCIYLVLKMSFYFRKLAKEIKRLTRQQQKVPWNRVLSF